MRALVVSLALLTSSAVVAQVDPETYDPTVIDVDVAPVAVTAYVGRASVLRRTSLWLETGAYELQFRAVPPTADRETLQARATGSVRITSVDSRADPAADGDAPRIVDLDQRIETAQRGIASLHEDRELVDAEAALVDAVSVRTTNDASDRGGTGALDLDVIRRQLAFVAEERARLLERRRAIGHEDRRLQRELRQLEAEREALAGASTGQRTAVVSLVVTNAADITVELVYLVTEATWAPRYNIRAASDGRGVTIEYDANLAQRSGEDWTDVELTLSTATPTVAADPPRLVPFFIDELAPARGSASRVPATAAPAPSFESEMLARAAADAAVAGAGPSVTFKLPRRVTVRSDVRQAQRTRIATIDAPADFVHVAIPRLTEAVYVRGSLVNSSAYQLLSGPVSIFVDQDYVGPTTLRPIAPGLAFDVYFGIDRAVTARRVVVSRETTRTGLLGGGRRTTSAYLVEIANGAGKTIMLELWDRAPVSRTDRVQVQLTDLSHALATDADYLADDEPQGLLKWLVAVPPGGAPYAVTWGETIARPKDLRITPLPED